MNQNKKNIIRKSGMVFETLPNVNFRVRFDDGQESLCHLAGKLKIYKIKILPGDRVTVEINPSDTKRGRIVYRGR
ncbi:MAG: translation initiation factor IF-1 [Candidatus Nealsonbacteria bacterium]|nr:translation initiation factor IF-1 [Candidatus Nealsonbacteria bacterium]